MGLPGVEKFEHQPAIQPGEAPPVPVGPVKDQVVRLHIGEVTTTQVKVDGLCRVGPSGVLVSMSVGQKVPKENFPILLEAPGPFP
jgi:hypothetical protein